MALIWAILYPDLGWAQTEGKDANGSEIVRLQLPWTHQFAFAGVYAAIAKGFYADRGLTVIPLEGEPDRDPVDRVLSGDADYGISETDLLVPLAKGAPLVALAAIQQHSPKVILARSDTGIRSVHDLVGRRLGLSNGCLPVLAYLASEGVDLDLVQTTERDFTPDALINGTVDALCASEADDPFLLNASGLDVVTFSPRASGIDFYGQILFTTTETLADRLERTEALRAATLQGWDYAMTHTREIAEWIRARHGTRHELAHLLFEAATLRPLIASDLVEPGYMNPGRWETIRDTYARFGLIRRDTDLTGFLSGPGAGTRTVLRTDPRLLYGALGLALVTLATGGIAWRITVMNRRLAREMAEREEAEAQMRDSENRYRTLVESAPYPIVIAGLDTDRILHTNARSESQLQISRHWARDKALSGFFTDPDRFRGFRDLLKRKGQANSLVTQMRTTGNGAFWADVSASIITFDGEPAVFASFSDISETKAMEQRLRDLAETDPLTGVANRRRFLDLLEREMERLRRYGGDLCLLQMDLDHFKSINDRFGHAGGDVALRHFTTVCLSALRNCDLLGRMGGEEFAALLPGTGTRGAMLTAERLCAAIRSKPAVDGNRTIDFTVSIGVTDIRLDDNAESALARGDHALYRAKNEGRNQAVGDLEAPSAPPDEIPEAVEAAASLDSGPLDSAILPPLHQG
ncbi:MAG: diguanylate cyclase [Rhodospirillum sp.]|nr:diguanylate cyclase [Rhodospirillum sp.]MCF8491818.1 diguanylate cyclase [Rhodospirillum sp.]MCF8502805.1 diguanylate cyclase [Rhodospirillum sp.]